MRSGWPSRPRKSPDEPEVEAVPARSTEMMEKPAESWDVLSLLRTTSEFLEARDVDEARLSAEHLLADVLDCGRLDLYLAFDRPVDSAELEAYRGRVRRRLAGEPVQYITGRAGFRGLDLHVDGRVLVPRPETEIVVGEVLGWARAEAGRGRTPAGGWRVLDLGTGSGAIALALAAELEDVGRIVGSDVSPGALEVAAENARRTEAGARVAWVAGDGFDPFGEGVRFDAIVANPPYVATSERSELSRGVAEWEPEVAVFAGSRGDEVVERVVEQAGARLRPGGLLALELARSQVGDVRRRIESSPGLETLSTVRDHAGIERGILALARGT